MLRFFDPGTCPCCGCALPRPSTSCPGCTLILHHPGVARLGGLLREADVVRDQLLTDPTAHLPLQATVGLPAPVGPHAPGEPPTSADDETAQARRQHGAARTMLLAVGALCLLSASGLFVVVAWLMLPWWCKVGLVGALASLAVAGAQATARRALRGSAETLAVIALGLSLLALGLVARHLPVRPDLTWGVGLAALVGAAWTTLWRTRGSAPRWVSVDVAGGLAAVGLAGIVASTSTPAVVLCAVVLGFVPATAWLWRTRPTLSQVGPWATAGWCLGIALLALDAGEGGARRGLGAATPTTAWSAAWSLPAVALSLALAALVTRRTRVAPVIASASATVITSWVALGLQRLGAEPRAWAFLAGLLVVSTLSAMTRRTDVHDRGTPAQAGQGGRATWWREALSPRLVPFAPGALIMGAGLAPGLVTGVREAFAPTVAATAQGPSSTVWLPVVLAVVLPWVGALRGRTGGVVDRPGPRSAVVAGTLVLPWCAWRHDLPATVMPHVGTSSTGAALVVALLCLLAPTRLRGRALDAAAVVWAAPALALVPDLRGLAVVLLVVAAALGLRAVSQHVEAPAVMATACALAAVWSLLADAAVMTVEAYSLSAALALAAWCVPQLLTRRGPTLSALPALTAAVAPSALQAMVEPHSSRALVVLTAALALVLVGLGRRAQAHLYVGGVATGAMAVAQAAPLLVLLPPWLPLAVGGILLLTLGITWEARLAGLRRARSRLAAMR